MIGISSKNSVGKVERFLQDLADGDVFSDLDRYGQMGVDALAAATPVDTGMSARSWEYRIIDDKGAPGIEWFNTNKINGTGPPVVILIQYGHGTGTGGYIPGYDFINPAMKPIFDRIEAEVWKKVI